MANRSIGRMDRLRAALGGECPALFVKRDDCTGLATGGNKTRKLEFLVADALAQGADTLITCGAPQSNHCRITLAAAVKEGLKCRFVIEERVPLYAAGLGNPGHVVQIRADEMTQRTLRDLVHVLLECCRYADYRGQ